MAIDLLASALSHNHLLDVHRIAVLLDWCQKERVIVAMVLLSHSLLVKWVMLVSARAGGVSVCFYCSGSRLRLDVF